MKEREIREAMGVEALERERLERTRDEGGKEAELNGESKEQSLMEAAMKGDTSVFVDVNVNSNYYYLSTTLGPKQNNIIHIAIENGRLQFIKEALANFPTLLGAKNADGDTPFHLASRLGSTHIVSFLICQFQKNDSISTTITTSRMNPGLVELTKPGSNYDEDYDDWLLAKNLKGNTALHVAITSRKIEAAATFCRECTQIQLERLFRIPNRNDQTALHLLARYYSADDLFDGWEDVMTLYTDILICAADLRTKQDGDGNTPLHLAIKYGKFCAAKFLLQRCLEAEQREELSIKNNEGDSVFDLLASQVHMNHETAKIMELKEMMIRIRRLVHERAFAERMMNDELYKAAVTMDCKVFLDILTRYEDDVECGSSILNPEDAHNFLSQTPNGSNIIHIALQQGKEEGMEFIEKALNRFPSLLLQADSNGETPLHLAAKWYNPVSKALLLCFVDVYRSVVGNRGVLAQPWKAKNSKGNMPIHEALRYNNVFGALVLMEIDHFGASYVNDLGETPLHVYSRFGFFPVEAKKVQLFDTLIDKCKIAAYTRDGDGLTPLLRAAKSGRFRTVLAILKHCPQSAYIQDLNGRTFLHILQLAGGDVDEHSADQLFKQMGENLFKIPEADAQRLVLDSEGNTPLHYAIKTENAITTEILTRRCLKTEDQPELTLVNNDGHTVLNLLASHEVPHEVVDLIRKRHRSIMYSARSSYGVRKADVKDSAGYLSVIAGLLATITFSAAFQVPGGFNGDNGFPVLLKRVAFQVFVVSDAIAMCSSMVVLFSLLWVMGSGKTFDSFVLLDISFILLQASFYATLLTFMTGVYVVTSSETLWLAIFSCALCSIVILVTWRRSVLFLSKHIRLVIDMLVTIRGCSFTRYIRHHDSIRGTH